MKLCGQFLYTQMTSHPKSLYHSLPERFSLAAGMPFVCGQVQNTGELIPPGLACNQPGKELVEKHPCFLVP